MVVSDYPVEFCSSIYHNPGLELNVFPVSIPSHLEMLVHIMKSPGCFRVNMNTDLLIHCEETIVHLIRQWFHHTSKFFSCGKYQKAVNYN